MLLMRNIMNLQRIRTQQKLMYHISGPPKTKLNQTDRNVVWCLMFGLFMIVPSYITYKIPQWAKAKKGSDA